MTRSSDQVAAEKAARERRERLDAAQEAMLRGMRHRPEDSSPRIRRLLGYDQPRRPPHVFDTPRLVNAAFDIWTRDDLGPVDPEPRSDRHRVRSVT